MKKFIFFTVLYGSYYIILEFPVLEANISKLNAQKL